MIKISKYLDNSTIRHIIYWVIVFVFYITSARGRFDSIEELFITTTFHLSFQIIIAYTILLKIIPRFLKNKNILELIIFVLLLFFGIKILYVTGRIFFLESKFPQCFKDELRGIGHLNFLQRIFNIKSFYFSLIFFYLQPLFFLVALQFYEKQLKLTEINEQKKIAELSALKNQLNPHFLFNTLNNLYALAIEKSDKTPEVIEQLSNILDYMIYGCNDRYVSLNKEIELIKNYISLEKVRYGKRVKIQFNMTIKKDVKIAPLLLLTFVENAFKHGVSQVLKNAIININIDLKDDYIHFTILNTKPKFSKNYNSNNKSVGIENVKKQLELLYKNNYLFKIENSNTNYLVTLKLKQH